MSNNIQSEDSLTEHIHKHKIHLQRIQPKSKHYQHHKMQIHNLRNHHITLNKIKKEQQQERKFYNLKSRNESINFTN